MGSLWGNEERKQIVQESLLLNEMSKNLAADLAQLESDLVAMKLRLKKVTHLHSLISQKGLTYSDTLNTYFGSVYGVEKSCLNTANYEDLKSRGFDLIRDDGLRFMINQFFEKSISRVKGYEKSESTVNEVMKPFYLHNFFEIDFTKYAVPINPEALLEDVYFQNLVYYRMINLKSNQLTHHPKMIREMKALLQRISEYLSKRDS